LEHDENELTAAILSHLEACPECGRFYRRACRCRGLVALKRYEIPSELRREACLAELHDRLVALQDQRAQGGYELHPALRLGIAAAVVAMVAAHFTAMSTAPRLSSPVTRDDLAYRTFEQFMENPFSNPRIFIIDSTSPTNYYPGPTTPPDSMYFINRPGRGTRN
jgi:hypothetical protein